MISLIQHFGAIISEEAGDPNTRDWLFISDKWIMFILFIYLLSIYVVLPLYMRYRRPYKLKTTIMIYNVCQIIGSCLAVYTIAYASTSGWKTYYPLGCQQLDPEFQLRLANYIWWYMILRMTELIEACLFILRKKFNQVSVLHVYHHIMVIAFAVLVIKYTSDTLPTFTILLNTSVHILMYSYYLLTSFGPKMQEKMKTVKPILTIIQIVQLILIILHSVLIILPDCQLTILQKSFFISYVLSLVVLVLFFINFYKQSFNKKRNVKSF